MSRSGKNWEVHWEVNKYDVGLCATIRKLKGPGEHQSGVTHRPAKKFLQGVGKSHNSASYTISPEGAGTGNIS